MLYESASILWKSAWIQYTPMWDHRGFPDQGIHDNGRCSTLDSAVIAETCQGQREYLRKSTGVSIGAFNITGNLLVGSRLSEDTFSSESTSMSESEITDEPRSFMVRGKEWQC